MKKNDNLGDKIKKYDSTWKVAEAFETVKKAMQDDTPIEGGSYAHAWHCNIAMCCYDTIREGVEEIPHEQAHAIANASASRFMKMCFDVETKN